MIKANILIIEDEASVAEDLSRKLRQFGYAVVGIAARAEEAISLAHATHPNLVLMNIHLKGPMDGIETAKAIRRDCDLPIVYLTDQSDDDATLERANSTEPFEFLVKPFEELTLEMHVRMALYKHETERRLRQSEAKYRIVADNTYDWEFWIDQESRFVYCSPSCERITGHKAEEFLADVTLSSRLIHPDDLKCFNTHVESVEHQRIPGQGEWRLVNPDGTSRWVSHVCQPVFGEHGEYLGCRSSNRDISGRKKTELALQQANEELQELVQERTAELQKANETSRAERALQESESRLARAQEIAHLGSWELDVVENHLTWSDETYRIFGYTPQDFPATYEAFLSRVHPDDRSAVDAAYSASLRDNQDIYEIEHRIVRKATGETRFVHERCQNIRDKNGRVIRSLGMVHDITDHKAAEEALRRSESQFRALVEQSPVGIFISDSKGHYIDVNHAGAEMLGYSREEILQRTIRDVIAPEEVQRLPAEVAVLASGRVTRTEWSFRRKDGSFFLGEIVARQLDDGRLQAVMRDITELKKAEQALRESRVIAEQRAAQLDAIFEAMVEPVFIFDGEARLTRLNAAAISLVGPEMVGGNIEKLREVKIHRRRRTPEGRPLEVEQLAFSRALRGEIVRNFNFLININNHEVVVEANASPIGGKDDIQGAVVVWHDVTQRKRAEADLQKLNAELEQRVASRTAELKASNAELESFAYSISHDLRSPLRAIDGFSRVLMDNYKSKLDEAGQDCLRRVCAAAQRMGDLIDSLLNLSRLNRAPMHRKAVNLGSIARQILNDLSEADPKRQVTTVIPEALEAVADPILIRSLMENLLRNAWKFTSKRNNTVIEVGLTVSNSSTDTCARAFFVRDNGVGFDMDYADKLFAPFQRLHDISEFPGTGIGLATVQRIVRRHGGRVWAEAAIDKGATFYFTLGLPEADSK